MIVHGYELRPTDLFGEVVEIAGSGYQAVLCERGWKGRATPEGRKRTAMLTGPLESPDAVVLYLIRRGHLRAPDGMWLPRWEFDRQPSLDR